MLVLLLLLLRLLFDAFVVANGVALVATPAIVVGVVATAFVVAIVVIVVAANYIRCWCCF